MDITVATREADGAEALRDYLPPGWSLWQVHRGDGPLDTDRVVIRAADAEPPPGWVALEQQPGELAWLAPLPMSFEEARRAAEMQPGSECYLVTLRPEAPEARRYRFLLGEAEELVAPEDRFEELRAAEEAGRAACRQAWERAVERIHQVRGGTLDWGVPPRPHQVELRRQSASGRHTVYHSSEAPDPEEHEEGWYFEPTGGFKMEIFSYRHTSPEEAMAAADAWELGGEKEALGAR